MNEGDGQEWPITGPWECAAGGLVDVFLHGTHYRRGIVDDVMPDASGFWLAAEGASLREFVNRRSGFQVRARRT